MGLDNWVKLRFVKSGSSVVSVEAFSYTGLRTQVHQARVKESLIARLPSQRLEMNWVKLRHVSSGSSACFPDIPYLRDLRLNDNPLQKLEANAFEMIPQLVSLDLTSCSIKKVAVKAFAQLNNLEKLYLSNNRWEQLTDPVRVFIEGFEPWSSYCRVSSCQLNIRSNYEKQEF